MLRPLSDRVLVKPITPEHPASPILLTDDPGPVVLGEVVAVGQGSARMQAHLSDAVRSLSDAVAHLQPADVADVGCGAVRVGDVLALIDRLQRRLAVPSEVAPGQIVVLPPSAGSELTVDGVAYLVVTEDSILAELEAE